MQQQNTGMSKLDEIKKLRERIEELEFVKDFQQDIIADMEIITGVDMAKKSLPETLAKEIELKKKIHALLLTIIQKRTGPNFIALLKGSGHYW